MHGMVRLLAQPLGALLRRPRPKDHVSIVAGKLREGSVLLAGDVARVERIPHCAVEKREAFANENGDPVNSMSEPRQLLSVEVPIAPLLREDPHAVDGTRDEVKLARQADLSWCSTLAHRMDLRHEKP